MIRSNGSTVIELPDTTSGIPLVLARSVKIRPEGNLEVPLECTRKLMDQMDVDHLYIGRDTVIAFAEQPTIESYNIELASDEQIKEHLTKPCNWVPQRHETLPQIPHNTAFICSPADVPGPRKVQLEDLEVTPDVKQKFEELCKRYGDTFSKNNEDIGRTKLVKMDIDTGDSPL